MTDAITVSAVVLAAGRASRMGEEKLLLMLGGKPVIRRIVETVVAARPLETVVVVNPRNRDPVVAEELLDLPDGVVPEVENAGGEGGVGVAGLEDVEHVLRRTRPAAFRGPCGER